GNYLVNQESELVQSAYLTDTSSVTLHLKENLALDKNYPISIFNLEDEAGNFTAEKTMDFIHDDQLDTILFAGNSLLDLYFKTEVDSLTSNEVLHYQVDQDVGHPGSAFRNAENFKLVHLIFDQDLPQNIPGTVRVQDMKDLSGYYINTHQKAFFQ